MTLRSTIKGIWKDLTGPRIVIINENNVHSPRKSGKKLKK